MDSSSSYEKKPAIMDQAQSNLQGMFQQAADDVRAHASKLEDRVFKPTREYAAYMWERHPVIAVFLGIFCILSFLPVLLFTSFALLTGGFLLSTSILFALLILGIILSLASLFLLAALAVTFCLSLGITAGLVAFWATTRLMGNIRVKGWQEGLLAWAWELREKVVGNSY
ncbi:hypothetical protein DACRYDRAFT_108103 [Dacryopinax primogenitus]|uniref:Uncharacterized protein n=1 Tax=Dacryopinax primogenitus (strain DJM 731) TaxID=1858805 RepID=M5G080_DACPD|nr:uncharacterized protein DACRYDRAFT_108103 [Dacryopinax primogenitus]EJU01560.1 hypothetical protein DACRYDRAFT_108103 [Dacryopinax primogenitus]